MIPGPALVAASTPGRTKIPTPMMQPMPIPMRSQARRVLRTRYGGSGDEQRASPDFCRAVSDGDLKGLLQLLEETKAAGAYGGVGLVITIAGGVAQVVQTVPDTPASRAGIKKDDVIVAVDGTPLTAGELLASADRLVHGFRDLGLAEGDCIAAILPNCWQFIALYLAAMQAAVAAGH